MPEIEIWYGPPGTGKTHKLMDILGEELKTVAPERIAYVSFTREGANQGVKRARSLFPNFKAKQFQYFRTLHSLAFKQMLFTKHEVMGPKDYKDFSHKLGMHFVGHYTEDLVSTDDKYLFWLDLYRNNPKAALGILDELDQEKLLFVRRNYLNYKRTFVKIDYTDMIERFFENNVSLDIDVAFIDEAQDLTTLQWKAVWMAFRRAKRIYIAGDDDQAIYQWSGADVDYFLNLKGNVNVLRQSYRVPSSVLGVANSITDKIAHRASKTYAPKDFQGKVHIVNSIEEVPIDNSKTYMFLSRNNLYLEDIDNMLMRKGIQFSHKGKASFSESDLELIKRYEAIRASKLITTEDDKNMLKYDFNAGSLDSPWYDRIKWSPEKIMFIRDAIKNKWKPTSKPNILVSTIHSVKGGEADVVVMLLDITKTVKRNLDKNPDAEHRVFYVGATRAKEELYIVNAHSQYAYPMQLRGIV